MIRSFNNSIMIITKINKFQIYNYILNEEIAHDSYSSKSKNRRLNNHKNAFTNRVGEKILREQIKNNIKREIT